MSDPSELPISAPASFPPTDDDATVIVPSLRAPVSSSSVLSPDPLPLGHTLQEYVIVGLVGAGGFGIVYRARDTRLGRMVALKEYMPSALATRGRGNEVLVRSERHRETFELGRRSFVNEAQLLAAFDHPSLVKVYRFWDQNGTAYMVMPFYEGPTLKQWLIERGYPNEGWLIDLLLPLMDALELMHQNRCYHRDIAPDNILLLERSATQAGALSPSGVRPVLLDFGAARRVIGDASQVLTVILKPGYAPVEQYAESASMKQGAWTDVYALCAVIYAAIAGKAPQPAVARLMHDELVPAVQVGEGRYSQGFLSVIDAGLAVRPENRPQDIAALRKLFLAAVPEMARHYMPARPSAPAVSSDSSEATPAAAVPTAAPAAPAVPPPAQAKPGAAVPPAPFQIPANAKAELEQKLGLATGAAPDAASPAPPAVDIGRMMMLFGGVLVLLAAVVGGAWWLMGDRNPPPARPDALAAPVPPPARPASAVSVTPPAAASVPVVASAVPPPAVPTPPADIPFDIVTALQDMVLHADPLFSVNLLSDKSRLTIGVDRLQFRVRSSESGYLYVFMSGTDKSQFYLLFPNGLDKNNAIRANEEIRLPRRKWFITAAGPPGTDHIVAVVSKYPRNLAEVGWKTSGEEIPEFDMARAKQLWASRQKDESPFLGRVQCEEAELRCDGAFGATLLEVEEVAKPNR